MDFLFLKQFIVYCIKLIGELRLSDKLKPHVITLCKVLNIVDWHSGYTLIIPCTAEMNADGVLDICERLIKSTVGQPLSIISDQTHFSCQANFKNGHKSMELDIKSPPYTTQSQMDKLWATIRKSLICLHQLSYKELIGLQQHLTLKHGCILGKQVKSRILFHYSPWTSTKTVLLRTTSSYTHLLVFCWKILSGRRKAHQSQVWSNHTSQQAQKNGTQL